MSKSFHFAVVALLVCSSSVLAVTPAQRQADLDWVRLELPRRHLNLFSVTPRETFDAAAADLQRSLEESTDEQFYTRLLMFVALARDAHTALGISGPAASAIGFRPLPLSLKLLDDGVFVTGAEPALVELNGARVLAVQGVPIDVVIERIRPVVSYENEWWFMAQAPNYLGNIGVLRGIGVLGAEDWPRFTLRLPGGETRDVELGPRTASLVPALKNADGFTPVMLRRTEENYWAEYWPDNRTLYIAYRRCAEMPWQPIKDFARELSLTLVSARLETIVVDLRGNTGGSSAYFEQLLDGVLFALNEASLRNPGLRAYGLVDRAVFSSGMIAAATLRNRFGSNIPLIGEPTGGSPVGYGEVVGFTLPGSELAGQYSTKFFNIVPGQQTIAPDIRVKTRSTDYFVRHDPALMVAITHATPDTADGPLLTALAEPRVEPASVVRLPASGLPLRPELLSVWVGLQKATVLGVDSEAVTFRLPFDAAGQMPVAVVVGDALSNAVPLLVSGAQ